MVRDFERRTGEKFNKPDDFYMTTTDSGFFMWKIERPILWINQVYGDGRYWRDYSFSLACLFNCRFMRTYTRRNPLVFVRKWGARILDYATYQDGDNVYTEYLLELEVK
jgi:hypothetical protein